MATGAISGKGGSATIGGSTVEVKQWSLEMKYDNPAFNSSETGGKTNRVAGNYDFSGTIEVILSGGEALSIGQGDYVAIDLSSADGTTILESTTDGDSIIDGISYNVNIESAEPPSATISFSRGRDHVAT